jgi:hypothetical protein
MKKSILLIIAFSLFLFSYGQWSAYQRQDLFDLAMNNFVLNKGLSTEQQKSLAKCFMRKISEENTVQQYNSLIEIEKEDIFNSAIDRCSKELGFILVKEEPVKTKASAPSNTTNPADNFFGNWQLENGSDELYLLNTYRYVYNYGSGIEEGTWKIENNKLVLTKDYLLISSPRYYSILSVKPNELILKTGRILKFIRK